MQQREASVRNSDSFAQLLYGWTVVLINNICKERSQFIQGLVKFGREVYFKLLVSGREGLMTVSMLAVFEECILDKMMMYNISL